MREIGNVESYKQTDKGLSVVLVGSPTCQPCKHLSAVFDTIPENGILFYKANIMDLPEVFMDLNIMSIPTVLFKKDGKICFRCGAVGPTELKEKIQELRSFKGE